MNPYSYLSWKEKILLKVGGPILTIGIIAIVMRPYSNGSPGLLIFAWVLLFLHQMQITGLSHACEKLQERVEALEKEKST